MTIVFVVLGFLIAVLFAAAGFRAVSLPRTRVLRKKLEYRGKIEALYDATVTRGLLTASSILQHAIVGKSTHSPSR